LRLLVVAGFTSHFSFLALTGNLALGPIAPVVLGSRDSGLGAKLFQQLVANNLFSGARSLITKREYNLPDLH
jgi:hypothetical protein